MSAVIDRRYYPGKPLAQMTIWRKRGGTGHMSNSGPTGWRLRAAARLHRALAEMAGAHRAARGLMRRPAA